MGLCGREYAENMLQIKNKFLKNGSFRCDSKVPTRENYLSKVPEAVWNYKVAVN